MLRPLVRMLVPAVLALAFLLPGVSHADRRYFLQSYTPYLAPVPHRGSKNQPAWVPLVGAAVAAAKGVPVDDVEAATTATAERLYRLQ